MPSGQTGWPGRRPDRLCSWHRPMGEVLEALRRLRRIMARQPTTRRLLIPRIPPATRSDPCCRSWTRIMLTRCQHLADPAYSGASPSSRGDQSPSTSAPHRRPTRTCVIGEVPDQASSDLADDDWFLSSRTGSRAWLLTPALSRQVTVLDKRGEVPERSARRLRRRRACPHRPHPRSQGQSEHA